MITIKDENGHSQVWPKTSGNRHRARRRIEAILNKIPAGKKVLELGCGHGELTAALIAKGCVVTALDRSPAMLELTAQACGDSPNLSLVQAEVLDFLEVSSEKCDAVVGMGILHHCVGDLDFTLSLMSKHLNTNGVGLFWEPNRSNPLARFIFGTFAGRRLMSLEKQEDAFTKADITPLLEKHFANFAVAPRDWAYPFMPVVLQNSASALESISPGFIRRLISQSLWIEFYQSTLDAKTESPR
jgi:SAM-dependent methyltransferase